MRKLVVSLAIAVGLLCSAVFIYLNYLYTYGDFDRKTNLLPKSAVETLEGANGFLLLSLDPSGVDPSEATVSSKEIFHNYLVLGETEIKDLSERARLLKALYKGIAGSRGELYMCFNPRHGIRATRNDEVVDLLICFECGSLYSYGVETQQVLTADSPAKMFNKALQKAGLPITTH